MPTISAISPNVVSIGPDADAENRSPASRSVARAPRLERTRPDGRVIEVRHNPVPGWRFRADLRRHHRAQTQRGRNPRRPRRGGGSQPHDRGRLSRPESRPGQSDPGGEDGVARPTHRRHRARDQEPAELRQQLRRSVGRSAERTEGNRRAGLRHADRRSARTRSTTSRPC